MTAYSAPAEQIDTSEMPTIHSFFRREFRLAGGVVRAVAVGDVARANQVADHVQYVSRCLHHHHTGEDELAWPLLLERVPEELAPIVRLMESQHERVDGLLEEIGERLPGWRRTAAADQRDRIGDLLDTLYVHLSEHLDAEEQRLLPIAARALTRQEWEALGEHGRRHTRRSEMLLTLGMFQHDGDPEVIGRMLAAAPAPVRWLMPRLARGAFRRHAMRIHGTATP